MNKKYYLLLIILCIMAVFFYCAKEGPMGPFGKDGSDGKDGIDVQNGFFIGGTLNFNAGIVGKGCTVKIDISDGYSVNNIDSASLNWTRGALSSNIYYAVGIKGYTPNGNMFFDIYTNLYSPSSGNLINIPTTEVYDSSGLEWYIPDTSFEIAGLRCDSSGYIISLEQDGMNEIYVVRKYDFTDGLLLSTLVSNQYFNISSVLAFNLDSFDNIYVCYSTNGVGVLKKYDSFGTFSNTYFPANNDRPVSIAVDTTGNIFIANDDPGSVKIYKYDSACALLTSFGFGEPIDPYSFSMEIDSIGNIIVFDSVNLVQKFNNNGSFLSQFNTEYAYVKIDLDSSDNIYLGARFKYSSSGSLITFISGGPLVAVDSTGNYVYGADWSGIKIIKYNKL